VAPDSVTTLRSDATEQGEQVRVKTETRLKEVVVKEGHTVGQHDEAQAEQPLKAAELEAAETVTTSQTGIVQQKAKLLPHTIGVSTC